jgi:hypothetical protein
MFHNADDIAGLHAIAVAGAMQPDGGAAAGNLKARRVQAGIFGHGDPL